MTKSMVCDSVRQSKAGVVLHLASAVTHIILSWEWCWIWNKVVTIPQFKKKKVGGGGGGGGARIKVLIFLHLCMIFVWGEKWHHHHGVMRSRWNWHYSDRLKWSGLCVLLSVCVDIVPCCILVCNFMMWPASLQGVPHSVWVWGQLWTLLFGQAFSQAYADHAFLWQGCQHVYLVWMVKFVQMYVVFLKLFVQCCEFKWF